MLDEMAGSGESGEEGAAAESPRDEPPLAAPWEDDGEAIVLGGGTIEDTDVNPAWAQVVQVLGPSSLCSGTLISPTHVLTAGHCFGGPGGMVSLKAVPGDPWFDTGAVDRRTYNIISWQVLNPGAGSGADLALLLLDEAVPSHQVEGWPEYAVEPASGWSSVSNASTTWTVGYGPADDCTGAGAGVRRGHPYDGGFTTYPGAPGVVSRVNLPCDHPEKGPSPGDSGGPLLDDLNLLTGVFSGWGCRDAHGTFGLPGCTGTIEWTRVDGANGDWIAATMDQDFDGDGILDYSDPLPGVNCNSGSPPPACAGLQPDFTVIDVQPLGCSGPGGNQRVAVTVRNDGPVAASAWVDVFVDEPSVPTPGMLSNIYARTDVLSEREFQTLTFEVNPALTWTWVDAIVDTTLEHDELDETNNVFSAWAYLPDC